MNLNHRNDTPAYAELHCISNFSFLRGASHPEELVARAAALGYCALALTDECSVAGIVRAHLAAKEHGLKLITGTEVRLDDGARLVLLAEDRNGYGHLCRLITTGRRRTAKGQYRLGRGDLDGGLPGCLAILIPGGGDHDAIAARWLAHVFPGRAWIGVHRHLLADDHQRMEHARRLARAGGLPLVACGGAVMHVRERKPLLDLVTAIRLHTTVDAAGFALAPNGEAHLRPREVLARLFEPAWLAESVRIGERCRFDLDSLRYEYPEEIVPDGETPASWLRRLTFEGMRARWPDGAPAKVRAQVEHELRIIGELRYEPYFLTVHDIVRFARSRGILCQGRGSAANSAVCYCLGITSVDPSRMEMLFERFVSRERREPPDIDVDFEHERREEVLQYIYGKYGRHRAALAATVIRYRRRSALRDAGKALGFSREQVDRLAAGVAWWEPDITSRQLREAGLNPDQPRVRSLLALARELVGFPRHLSQHVGGFVIARRSLAELVPVENAAMAGRTVIQWDKDDIDALGLLKVDCLGLGMLSVIRRAFDLVARHRGRRLDLASVPAEAPDVYAMIQRADTVGVFQIESRAQMSMLPRLKPACFYDLVIEVAIVRPGPIQGDMVHPYLRRRQGLEPVTYPSEAVRGVLERTLGVPIFQEQVIKLAMVAAGFSAGEADALRRALGGWRRRGTLERFRARLLEGMRERGYSGHFAEQIFRQIQGFGEYGFPESHAASFALLAYVSAWLKHHEPAAFCCALLNSQPMGFYAPAQLVQDARRHGVEVRPVDVCASDWDCTLEPASRPAAGHDLALRLGLRMVKGLSRAGAQRLLEARAARPFTGVRDFLARTRLDARDRRALAAADALAGLAGHRHRAHWYVLEPGGDPPLAPAPDEDKVVPLLRPPAEGRQVVMDYASTGLSLRRHPLALLRPRLAALGALDAAALARVAHDDTAHYVGLVINRQHPGSANGVVFLTLEDETGHVNVIVWASLVTRHRREVLHGRLLGVHGTVQREDGVQHLVARRLVDHSHLLGDLVTPSRDFR